MTSTQGQVPTEQDPGTSTRVDLWSVVTKTGIGAWSIVGVLALMWVGVWMLGRAEILIAPVVLSVALIYVLNPIVNRLASMGVPRLLGGLIAFLVLIGVLVLIGFLVVPSVREQATSFTNDLPALYENTTEQLEILLDNFGFSNVSLPSYEEAQSFIDDPENQDRFISAISERLGAVTSGILEAILVFFIAPVIAFYVLIDLPRIREESEELIPERNRDEVVHVSRNLGHAVGGFLRGQVFVAIIVGVLTSVGFALIGLKFWLIIGMTAGFLNIIPFVGPWVGGGLGFIVGLVDGDLSKALLAALVAFIVQQIDNNFVSPTVLRATVRLHPAVVILVLLLGGAVGGLWGVLLAVPVTASIKIIAGHLWRTRVLGQSWDEASDALMLDPDERTSFIKKIRQEADFALDDDGEGAKKATVNQKSDDT
ncbi:MAG: AI-2E family transporter [Acidimicrobiia bacterium]|nr:AI-2E family transporter [Acidimicrobiia bacterium]